MPLTRLEQNQDSSCRQTNCLLCQRSVTWLETWIEYFTWSSDECLTFFPNAKYRLQITCSHFLPNWTKPRRHPPLGPQPLKWTWMAGRWSRMKNPLWQICRLRLKNWEGLWTCYRGDKSEYCFSKNKNHFSKFAFLFIHVNQHAQLDISGQSLINVFFVVVFTQARHYRTERRIKSREK